MCGLEQTTPAISVRVGGSHNVRLTVLSILKCNFDS